MKNKVEINFEYLDKIKYHELEDKLTELGVANAWKGGKKKVDIINDALSMLAKIRGLKNEGVTEDDIEKQLDVIAAVEKEQAQAAILAEEIAEEERKEAELEQAKEKKFSKPQLERQLEVIDANLANNVSGQRATLLEKRALVITMLKEF